MTIQQAIEHCEEVARTCGIKDCEEEHLQLADWLRELEKYKQNDFIELTVYYNGDNYQLLTKPIAIRKNQIFQFYETYTKFYTTCTRIITNKEIYNVKESYNKIKELLS